MVNFDINDFNTTHKCQFFVDLNLTNARYERVKAAGYAALALITAVAISAITYYGCVTLRAAYLLTFADPVMWMWMDEFTLAEMILSPAGILNGLAAFYPIKMVAGDFFKQAQERWVASNKLYSQVELVAERKIALA